jgi:LPS sulfotransferase NodH
MLRETGCAGRPLEHFEILHHTGLPRQPREYFEGLDDPEVVERLEPLKTGSDESLAPEEWRDRVVADGLTANGVWGGKLMWGHVENLVERVTRLPGQDGVDLARALEALLGRRPVLVFVTRGDKVSQAVSLWRALQTQTWRAAHPGEAVPDAEVVYNHAAIDHLLSRLHDDEAAWEAWFEATGRQPVEITYEELDADPQAPVSRVLGTLGCDAPLPLPRLARQRDELSADWVARFRRESERVA